MSEIVQLLFAILFSIGEEATLGILRALKNRRLQGKIKFIVFDFNATVRKAILNHEKDATIVKSLFFRWTT